MTSGFERRGRLKAVKGELVPKSRVSEWGLQTKVQAYAAIDGEMAEREVKK
jgi:hypothetical protein